MKTIIIKGKYTPVGYRGFITWDNQTCRDSEHDGLYEYVVNHTPKLLSRIHEFLYNNGEISNKEAQAMAQHITTIATIELDEYGIHTIDLDYDI